MNKRLFLFGDSITYGKWDILGGWAARVRAHIDANYNIGKKGNYQVYNLGIPGDLVVTMAERIESEMKPRLDPKYEPVAVLAAGINDSCPNNIFTGKQTPEVVFKDSYRRMIAVARKNGATVFAVGLAPVNSARSKGMLFSNEAAKIYESYVVDVCAEEHVPCLPLFDVLGTQFANYIVEDSVHPNDKGHEILVGLIISFLKEHKVL